jgi:hypothetical protein
VTGYLLAFVSLSGTYILVVQGPSLVSSPNARFEIICAHWACPFSHFEFVILSQQNIPNFAKAHQVGMTLSTMGHIFLLKTTNKKEQVNRHHEAPHRTLPLQTAK